MIAQRRSAWNFGLQRAVEWSRRLRRPLLVLEPLRLGYRWASDRIHQFVIDGMWENRARFTRRGCTYAAYLEPEPGMGKGLLEAVASDACVVVTDDSPSFFLPRMLAAAGRRLTVALEAVDGNGLLPLGLADRTFARAHDFRRFAHKHLAEMLDAPPAADPLAELPCLTAPQIPRGVSDRWGFVDFNNPETTNVARLPIDHRVSPVGIRGGSGAATHRLARFLDRDLMRYGNERSDPDADVGSGLSAYLHFGHIGPHQVLAALARRFGWTPADIEPAAGGRREGWWGLPAPVEAFLDELVTWREVGFNMAAREAGYDRYDSLPSWARRTLSEHAGDGRAHIYDERAFAQARTHDALWNAAQGQLVREGRIHNYLRMLWGKKILEWTASPEEAAHIMIELNNRYGVDGRDPNSYSGIFWILGRYDRPWGPERPIFGKVRYMSSANTLRKFNADRYVATYGT